MVRYTNACHVGNIFEQKNVAYGRILLKFTSHSNLQKINEIFYKLEKMSKSNF